ncbi:MAG: serine hydrolase domain-containing protein [Lysobacterales bacterium]
MKTAIAFVLTALCAMTACASRTAQREAPVSVAPYSLDGAELDAEVARLMGAAKVPGLALAVIRDGRIRHLRAYGRRDIARDLPLQDDTVMYGASLTKATFATLVMTLVADGTLDLDKPVADYLPKPLPDYPDYADLAGDSRWRAITARMLLSHTSGFPNWRFFTPKGYDETGKLDIATDPGSTYAYSGEGIQLLQFVLETGLQLDIRALMRERIFQPVGMRHTDMLWQPAYAGNATVGYLADGSPVPHDQQDNVRAAGSMDTSISDYAHFLQALVNGRVLSASTLDAMLTPQVAIDSIQQFPTRGMPKTADNVGIGLAYGLGWGLFRTPRGEAFFKEGHNDSTSNYALCIPKARDCVLLMSNSANAEGIFKYLVDATLGETCLPWFWEAYIPYDKPEWGKSDAPSRPHSPCAAMAPPGT